MIPDKYKDLPERFKQLFAWGNPMKPGYSYRHWEDYLHHGFSDADIPVLLELLSDKQLPRSPDMNQVPVPLYAWRILGQLRSVEAIDLLIALTLEHQNNHFIQSEVAVALGMIGKPAMAQIAGMLLDEFETESQKKTAAETLAAIAEEYPELREEVISHFRAYLQSPNPDYRSYNGFLVSHLIDIEAVELIDEIRDLYEEDYVDLSVAGDIEDVEIELGLREERSTPSKMVDLSRLFGLTGSDTPSRPVRNIVASTPETYVRETVKVGRNEPCPCGSGKKHKRCYMNNPKD